MNRLLVTFLKIVIASLVAGIVLHRLNLSADQILLELGIAPEWLITGMERGARWAIPNIVLGALVVVPVWLVVHLFRPPRR